MAATGYLVGWRVRTSILEAAAGFLLLLAFAYAFSWIMAYVGLIVPLPEVVNNASFLVIFPFPFVAKPFLPAECPHPVLTVGTAVRRERECQGGCITGVGG